MSTEDKFLLAAERSIYESITKMLANDYNSPVKDAVMNVVSKHQSKLEGIVEDAFLSLLDSASFNQSIKQAMYDKVARSLVSKLGGEIESRVNELKADPKTRAKITLAISEIAAI
jgi:hypothetical protein